MLAVVKDDQRPTASEVSDNGFHSHSTRLSSESKRNEKDRRDEGGIQHRRELDHPNAVGKDVKLLRSKLVGNACLSCAAGANDAQHPRGLKETGTIEQLASTPEERRLLQRQVVNDSLQRPQRRQVVIEVRVAELEELELIRKVAQSVRAQLPPRRAIRKKRSRLDRRERRDDLSAMSSRGDPRCLVHDKPYIVVSAATSTAGVQAHAHPDGRSLRPPVTREGLLGSKRRRYGICRILERDEEGVTLR